MEKNIYTTTRKLIELSEISLSGAKYIFSIKKNSLFSWEFDIRLPMGYMLIGGKDFFLPYKKAFFLLFILLLIIFLFNNLIFKANLETELQVLATFLMMIAFALPSRYAYYSTNDESVNKVINIISTLKVKNKSELDLIEKNIESIYLRVQDRIKALKWLISVCWIIYIFINKQVIAFFKVAKDEGKYIDSSLYNLLSDNYIIIMYFILPIIFVSVYRRGTSFLFQSILFALNDYKIYIQDKTNKPLQKTFLKITNKN